LLYLNGALLKTVKGFYELKDLGSSTAMSAHLCHPVPGFILKKRHKARQMG